MTLFEPAPQQQPAPHDPMPPQPQSWLSALCPAPDAFLDQPTIQALAQSGLSIAPETLASLVKTENEALLDAGRLAVGPSAVPQLVSEFAASPHLNQTDAAQTLADLLEAFCQLRSELPVHVPDQEILDELRHAFDGEASGDASLALYVAQEELKDSAWLQVQPAAWSQVQPAEQPAGLAAQTCSPQDMDSVLDSYEIVDDQGRAWRIGSVLQKDSYATTKSDSLGTGQDPNNDPWSENLTADGWYGERWGDWEDWNE